jgi:broad specificity phosphatase PhoE
MPPPVIYYVRHGLTDWNVEQRLQGRHDIPLNAEGCAQAVRCGEILRDLILRTGRAPADLGYVSSPLSRARRTMELLRTTLGLDPTGYPIDHRLAEIAFGDWEGLTYDDVLARDRHVFAEREADKWGFLPPGGESYAQVTERIGEWYRTLEHDIVVAAHGGTARALMAHLAIASPEAATRYPFEHGMVYEFAGPKLTRHG